METDGGTGSVNYFLDGGTNMTNLRNTGNALPSPDAIQNFESDECIQCRAAGLQMASSMSSPNPVQINFVVRSEFVRNDAFNANGWGSVVDKAPYRRNQFGGTIGRPIIRDRTFFFFSYAGLRQMTSRFLKVLVCLQSLNMAIYGRLGSNVRNRRERNAHSLRYEYHLPKYDRSCRGSDHQ